MQGQLKDAETKNNEEKDNMIQQQLLEVESLRILIRGIAMGDNLDTLKSFIVYSKKYSKCIFGSS